MASKKKIIFFYKKTCLNEMNNIPLHSLLKRRAISSVGSEHLAYTEGVGSSSLSSPTIKKAIQILDGFFC